MSRRGLTEREIRAAVARMRMSQAEKDELVRQVLAGRSEALFALEWLMKRLED